MAGVVNSEFQESILHTKQTEEKPPINTLSPGSMESAETSSSEGSTPSTPALSKSPAPSPSAADDGKDEEEGGNSEEKAAGKEGEDDVVVIDTAFTCKIMAPGVDSFEIKVSSEEIVQEVKNLLMDTEELCTRTCFSLQLSGQVLDQFTELKNIPALKQNSVIKVVEEPYTVREARFHVKRIKEILASCDLTDAYSGSNYASLSFVNSVWNGGEGGTGATGEKKKRSGGQQQSDSIDCSPPDYIMPGSKERPLLPLHPHQHERMGPSCVKVLTYDGWNPPPGCRKLRGDLLYLQLLTVEDKKIHITSSTRGFYVNQSTEDTYGPGRRDTQSSRVHHSLVDLLATISPGFKKYWAQLVTKRYSRHAFECIPTPYQIYSWLSPQMDHTLDVVRMEDGMMTGRLCYEDVLPTGNRDWNEEFQMVKELPKKNLPERLDRERSMFKVNSDFVWAATRGATLVVEGCLMAINPGEQSKMQMFIWNNIFFSMGFDVKDHYKDFGGDSAAYVAPAKDLQGVRAYSELDIDGLCVLGTVVIDYRGYRITAQSIIPGILEREQEQSVVYGSIDFGKTISTNEKYKELLEKAAGPLRIKPHKVINHEGETIEIYSSVDCKGIIGNDGRHYILDLLRTFPPDVNYLEEPGVELTQSLKALGYPLKSSHKLVTLRQELVDAYFEFSYVRFMKTSAHLFEKKRQEKEAGKETKSIESSSEKGEKESSEDGEKPTEKGDKSQVAKDDQESVDSALREAAAALGTSGSGTQFAVCFNPDLYQLYVKHSADAEGEEDDSDAQKELAKDKQMLTEAAEFLVQSRIPSFVKQCLEHNTGLMDGTSLTETLHARGINMRYMGRIATLLEEHETLNYILALCVSEMVCRSAKHLFQLHMHNVDPMNLASALAHFLNCLLSSCSTPHAAFEELHTRNKKKQKKKNRGVVNSNDNVDWASESPKSLWTKLTEDVYARYNYDLRGSVDSLDLAAEKYGFQKASLLRAFCQKVGLQLALREYNLESKNRQAFFEDDIVNTFPVVKHVAPRATDAYHFFTNGQSRIQAGHFQEGYRLIAEALNLLSVYGPMHPEIAACCRLIARLNYLMGEYGEALSYQQKAAIMNERCLGIDHHSTVTDYTHLAIYSFANNQVSSALQLLYRARYLLLLLFGENHPEVSLLDINIGLVLHGVGEYELSIHFLENAKELFKKFYGEKSLKVATAYHLLARAHSCRGEFRLALQSEKEAFAVYKQKLGEDHEKTKESSDCLKHLTHQAVIFQKKMNEIERTNTAVSLPTLQAMLASIQVPSMKSILETLNVINGIAVPIPLSMQDVQKIRTELAKQQQQQQQQTDDNGKAEPGEITSITTEDASTTTEPITSATGTAAAAGGAILPVDEDVE